MWDKPDADWRLGKTYSLIHKLQPQALIGNNHHRAPFPAKISRCSRRTCRARTRRLQQASPKSAHCRWKPARRINGAWGYNKNDKSFKTTAELVHYLVAAAGNNANFLLNVGPMPDGKIQPEFVERLRGDGRSGWQRTANRSTAPAAARSRRAPGA